MAAPLNQGVALGSNPCLSVCPHRLHLKMAMWSYSGGAPISAGAIFMTVLTCSIIVLGSGHRGHSWFGN
jgi:hypothetical protein